MDKARITVKLGQADPHQGKRWPEKEQLWFDTKRDEKNLLFAESVTAVVNEEENSNQGDYFGPKYVPPKTKKNAYSSKRFYHLPQRGISKKRIIAIAISIIGAIAVGLIFGNIVLNFLKSGTFAESAKTLVNEIDSKNTSVSAPAANAQQGKVAEAGATRLSVTIPAQTFYVIQGGVFQDQANAAPILEKIKSHGWPYTFVGEKPYYLLLGIFANRDNALAMAVPYKELNVYIKDFKVESQTLSVPLKEGTKSSEEDWNQWLDTESQFTKNLGQALGQGLTNSKITEDELKGVISAHRELLQKGRDLINKLPEKNREIGDRLFNDYTKGVSAIEHYQKEASEGYLWEAEQSLLDAYTDRNQLFSSFKQA